MSTNALLIFILVAGVCLVALVVLALILWGPNNRSAGEARPRSALWLRPDVRPPGARRTSEVEGLSGATGAAQSSGMQAVEEIVPREQVARRLVELAGPHDLTKDQMRLCLDGAYLDMRLSARDSIEEWIRPWAKIRAIGHQLVREGGGALLRVVGEEVCHIDEVTIATAQPITVSRVDGDHIIREDTSLVGFSAALGLIDAVWESLGRTPEQVASEVFELATVSASKFSEVPDDRKALLWSGDYLDEVISSTEEVEEALRARAGIRAAGYRLDCADGVELMRTVHAMLSSNPQQQLLVGILWGGGSSGNGRPIGEWRN